MIPNTSLTRKRSKGDGDFLVCRKCNSHKSNMDYVIGVIAKSQSSDRNLAVESLIRASTKTDGREKIFLDMIRTAVQKNDGNIHLKIPVHADDLIAYMQYLGKGQYFKVHKRPLNLKRYVMHLEFINKQVTQTFQSSYQCYHHSNPFIDIRQNPYSEVIGGGEVIIWHKNKDSYLFLFHDYVGFIIDIKKQCRRHVERAKQKVDYIRRNFMYDKSG